jgi:phage terminase large subunit-like protein
MKARASAAALAAGHPEAFDDRPDWLRQVDGDERYDWARTAWDSAAAEPGAWFDHQLADSIVADWPNWATLTLDRFAGVKFRLAQWQDIIVRLLVGWMVPTEILDPATHEKITVHIRLFRRLLLWISRKNGKSEFLAALGLLFFIVDGVADGEGYCFARNEKQARIVLKKMKAMIAFNPEWTQEVLTYRRSFYVKQLAAGFEMLTGSEEGKHGGSPSVVVGDEMHEWKSRTIAETLEEGVGARLEWMFLYGSTAGTKTNPTGQECWDESIAILEGRLEDPRTLVVVFAAAPEDDIFDEAVWKKANPNLGVSPTCRSCAPRPRRPAAIPAPRRASAATT